MKLSCLAVIWQPLHKGQFNGQYLYTCPNLVVWDAWAAFNYYWYVAALCNYFRIRPYQQYYQKYANINCSWGEWWKIFVLKWNSPLTYYGPLWIVILKVQWFLPFPDQKSSQYTTFIDRFSPCRTIKVLPAVTASLRVREILKTTTHEHYQN